MRNPKLESDIERWKIMVQVVGRAVANIVRR